jgi:MFS family permease
MPAGRATASFRNRLFTLNLPRDIALLVWGMVVWDLGFGLYSNLWPLFIEDLGATPAQIGIIIGLQGFARLAIMLPSGIAADRYSRRFMIWGATALSVPSVLIYLISGTWWHLLPGLMLGALANVSVPAISSYTAEAAAPRDRARAFAMVYTVGPSAALIVAPIIGGWLSEATSLQFLFLPTAILYALSTVVFWLISERPHQHRADRPSSSYRDALQHRAVLMSSLLQMLILFFLTMGITFIPNYLQDEHDANLAQIGQLGAIGAVGSILLSLLVGKIKWLSPARGIAMASGAIGIVCLATVLIDSIWFLAIFFIFRGGFNVAWSLFAAVLGDTVPERLRGRSFAMAEFLGGIGFAVAPFVAGPLYGIDPKLPLIVTAIGAPFLIVLTLIFEKRVVKPAMERNALEMA